MQADTVEDLNETVALAVRAAGYVFVGMERLPQGGGLLRIYIDHDSGVGVDDCATCSQHLAGVLWEGVPLCEQYAMEVSSPGIERPLFTPEQVQFFVGEQARITLSRPLDNRRHWQGALCGMDDEGHSVLLEVDGQRVALPWDQVHAACLKPDWKTVLKRS